MSRALAVALLAQGALAAVNIHYIPDLPEVTPAPTNVEIPGVNQLADIVAAAAATDAPRGLEACADAENLIQYCVDEIPNFTKAANSVIAACMCCSRSSYVAPLYSSCKSYITASAPQYTNDYTLVSIASSLCTAQGRGICSATGLASGTASATGSTRTARSSITAASRPAACSSFASIIQSCSRKDDDFLSQGGRQQASCICYSGRTYTTKFDDYASSCASWARTGLSTGYSDIAELSTFCEDYPASRTSSRGRGSSSDDDTTTAGSGGGGGVGGSGGATTTPDNGPKSTVTVPPPTTTGPPRSPAARNAASALFVLGAVFAGMLLA